MGIFNRLFGKRSPDIAPPPERRLPAPEALHAASTGAGDSGTEAPAEQPATRQEDATIAPEPTVTASPPLRTLTRYQHDPAFNNFKQRLTRAPGQDRTRGRNPDYPPPDESKR